MLTTLHVEYYKNKHEFAIVWPCPEWRWRHFVHYSNRYRCVGAPVVREINIMYWSRGYTSQVTKPVIYWLICTSQYYWPVGVVVRDPDC